MWALERHPIRLDSLRKGNKIIAMKTFGTSPRVPSSSGMIRRQIGGAVARASNRSASFLNWKHLAICALAVALSATPFYAQKGAPAGGGGSAHPSTGSTGGPVALPNNTSIYGPPSMGPVWQPLPDNPPLPGPTAVVQDEKCLPWNVSDIRAAAVSVARLNVPSKARHEYEKACDANNNKKFEDAEQHARGAIDKFQDYGAAWVLLGVVLEEEKKAPEALDACSHAMSIDATYVQGYLCKEEFSIRNEQWEDALNLSSVALGLNSMGDGYVYYYRAMANFHLHHLVEAKKSALQAVDIDIKRNEAPLSFLLALIYDASGDKVNAAEQLRQILKHHAGGPQEDEARALLAKLESQQDSK
jgi:Flp pilus assembly protein TadD